MRLRDLAARLGAGETLDERRYIREIGLPGEAARLMPGIAATEAMAVRQPPIEDYGFIGDCRTGALVSRAGSIDWLCLPNFGSPSVFAAILSPTGGGCFSSSPRAAFATRRRYLDQTCVLETTFHTPSGVARLVDALPIVDARYSLNPMRELLRMIEGISGDVEMTIRIDPRPNYARTQPRLRAFGPLAWSYNWSNEVLFVNTDVGLTREVNALSGVAQIRAEQRRYISLAYVQGDPAVIPPLGDAAATRLDRTIAWWRRWS
jgi:GH15 family glucan-1,4-alpha-glucosidase